MNATWNRWLPASWTFSFREHFFCSQFSSLCSSHYSPELLFFPTLSRSLNKWRCIETYKKWFVFSSGSNESTKIPHIHYTIPSLLLKCRKKRWRMKRKIFHPFCIMLVIMAWMSVYMCKHFIYSNTLFVQQDSYSIQTLELHFSITMKMQILYLRIEC